MIPLNYHTSFGSRATDFFSLAIDDSIYTSIIPEKSKKEISISVLHPENGEISTSYLFEKNNILIKNGIGKIFTGLDIKETIKNLSIGTGTYKIKLSPVTKLYDVDLKIKQLSSSGLEIKLFSSDNTVVRNFIGNVIPFSYYEAYYKDLIANYPTILKINQFLEKNIEFKENIKYYNSIHTDPLLTFYIYDIFSGVKRNNVKADSSISKYEIISILENVNYFLYKNYNEFLSDVEILKNIESIVEKCIRYNFLTRGYSTEKINSKLKEFYLSIFKEIFAEVSVYNKNNFFSEYRSCLYINNKLYPIVNKKYYFENGYDILVVKLSESAVGVDKDSPVYLCSHEYESVADQIIYYISENKIKTKVLKSSIVTYESDVQNLEPTNGMVTSSLKVDYSKFENFILFSSVSSRIDTFISKRDRIQKLTEYISNVGLDNGSKLKFSNEIEEIKTSFDGYEKYLFSNINNLYDHTENKIHENYDLDNKNSLYNNIPTIVKSDPDNSEYVNYVKMVGHLLDNIWIYIENFPSLVKTSDLGSSLAREILSSSGWGVSGGYDLSKTNWSKILETVENLPNKKGTFESLQSIINAYNIPENVLKVREFKYGENNFRTNFYSNEYRSVPFIAKRNEYITIPSSDKIKDIEFSFKLLNLYYFEDKVTICQSIDPYDKIKWEIFLVKNNFGKYDLNFSILNNTSNYTTSNIKNINFSEDSEYSVRLTFSEESSTDAGEIKIRIINSVDDIVFDQSSNIIPLKNELVNMKSDYDFIVFGNYFDSDTYFVGTIDQINIWKVRLTDLEFESHSRAYKNYSLQSIDSTLSDLYARMSFDYPTNLFSNGGIKTIHTDVSYRTEVNFSFVNFNNQNEFPYNFKIYNIDRKYESFDIFECSFGKTKPETDITYSPSLSPDISLLGNSSRSQTLPKIGIFYSTKEKYNSRIINILSNFDVGSQLAEENRNKLNYLIRKYIDIFKFDGSQRSEIEFAKKYIDPSVYDQLRNVIPTKNKIIDGILVEQSPLEKIKFGEVQQIISVDNEFTNASVKKLMKVNSILPTNLTEEINIQFSNKNTLSKQSEFNFVSYDDSDLYYAAAFNHPFLRGSIVVDNELKIIKKINDIPSLIELRKQHSIEVINAKPIGKIKGIVEQIGGESFRAAVEFTGVIDIKDYGVVSLETNQLKLTGEIFGTIGNPLVNVSQYVDTTFTASDYSNFTLESLSGSDIIDEIFSNGIGTGRKYFSNAFIRNKYMPSAIENFYIYLGNMEFDGYVTGDVILQSGGTVYSGTKLEIVGKLSTVGSVDPEEELLITNSKKLYMSFKTTSRLDPTVEDSKIKRTDGKISITDVVLWANESQDISTSIQESNNLSNTRLKTKLIKNADEQINNTFPTRPIKSINRAIMRNPSRRSWIYSKNTKNMTIMETGDLDSSLPF